MDILLRLPSSTGILPLQPKASPISAFMLARGMGRRRMARIASLFHLHGGYVIKMASVRERERSFGVTFNF